MGKHKNANFGQIYEFFCDLYDFRKAVPTAFLGIKKIPTVNVEIHFFSFCLFNLCLAKLNLWYRLKDILAVLGGRKEIRT